MWLKLTILMLLALIVISLFSGLFFLMKDTVLEKKLTG